MITPTANTTVTITGSSSVGCISTKTISVFTQVCGQSGSSLSMDGINDVVNTPVNFNSTTYQNWTYECWAKSPSAPYPIMDMMDQCMEQIWELFGIMAHHHLLVLLQFNLQVAHIGKQLMEHY